MNRRHLNVLALTGFLLAGGLQARAAAENDVFALMNLRIIPVSGKDIPSGIILIRGARIAEVGADVAVPPGAEVIDGTGLTAYPGMIDCHSYLGMLEISNVAATVDYQETGLTNPQIKAVEGLRPDSVHIPIARAHGITAAHIIPEGAFVAGRTGLIRLTGWTPDEMVIRDEVAMHMVFPSHPGFLFMQMVGKTQPAEKAVSQIKDYLKRVRLYGERKRMAADRPGSVPHEYDESCEEMLPVVEGRLPVMLSVHSEEDIRAAIDLVKEENLKAIFFGVSEGWKVADDLKKAGIPVILGNLYSAYHDFDDGYDRHWRAPAVLQEAGVLFALGTQKMLPPLGKDLPFFAAKAVAFGLDRRAALRAVTLNAAEILGVDDLMGSLEPGKLANIVLADGDPFEFKTKIKAVFIDGKKVDLNNLYTDKIKQFQKRFR